jgi:hypothetical protein
MIQPGTHRARALSGGLGYTSGGKEQVGIDFQIVAGEHEGEHISWWGYFTDKTVDKTIEALRTCGWEGDDLCDLTGIEINEVDLVVQFKEYTDKKTGEVRDGVEVRWINRASGLQMRDKMDSGQAAAFAAKMRGRVVALRSGNGKAAAPAPRPQPKFPTGPGAAAPLQQAIDNDDIPF